MIKKNNTLDANLESYFFIKFFFLTLNPGDVTHRLLSWSLMRAALSTCFVPSKVSNSKFCK